MLKGGNILRLNEATMMEIVQQWLDRNVVEGNATRVVSITHEHDFNGNEFVVRLGEKDKEPK